MLYPLSTLSRMAEASPPVVARFTLNVPDMVDFFVANSSVKIGKSI